MEIQIPVKDKQKQKEMGAMDKTNKEEDHQPTTE